LLDWNKIHLNYKINVNEFRKIFEWLFKQINYINIVLYNIKNELEINQINIEYLKDWKVIIWFDLNWKNINIYLSWEKISYLKKDWKIIKRNIKVYDLQNYLLNLKK
jgi:hypothetical protein